MINSDSIFSFAKRPIVTISCGTESVVLIDVISKIRSDIPFVFIDTGFHFEETLRYYEILKKTYNSIKFIKIASKRSEDFRGLHKQGKYEILDRCCKENKVDLLNSYMELNRVDMWISGVRKSQTESRARKEQIEKNENGITKVYPLFEWSDDDVKSYIKMHSLPTHPLVDEGYYSIGCEPCTKKATDRSGRWSGIKNECGLHA